MLDSKDDKLTELLDRLKRLTDKQADIEKKMKAFEDVLDVKESEE